jgi:hypothetical protein
VGKAKSVKPATLHEFKLKKALLWGLLSVNAVVSPTILAMWAAGEFNVGNAETKVVQQQQESTAASQKAKSFALDFAHEYFTWNIGYEDVRAKRLQSFLVKGLDPQAGINFSTITKNARPDHIELWDVIDKGEKKSVIVVMAKVNIFEPKTDAPAVIERLLAIPIQAVNENQFVVNDIPYYLPVPEPSSVMKRKEVFDGDRVDATVTSQVDRSLQNFFKIYFSGDANEIAYLAKTKTPLQGFKGAFEFLSMDDLEVVRQGDNYLADCLVYVKDDTGMEMTLPYQIQLSQEDGHWFVTDIINRD